MQRCVGDSCLNPALLPTESRAALRGERWEGEIRAWRQGGFEAGSPRGYAYSDKYSLYCLIQVALQLLRFSTSAARVEVRSAAQREAGTRGAGVEAQE